MSFRGKALRALSLAGLALLFAGCGEYPQSIFRPVTDFAESLDDLFMWIFWWTLGVLVLVELAIVYVMIRFREKPGQPRPKQVHGNTKAEIIWTIIPAVILIFIALPTVRVIFTSYQPAPQGALVVEAVAHQWWWEFRYPEYNLVTANELRLPVGRPVHIKLRSADVLHNFWVPALGGKRYNFPVPAKTEGEQPSGHELFNVLTFTIREAGVYSGQCAEYCGESHALMRMRTVAESPADFDAWVASMGGAAPAAQTPGVAAVLPSTVPAVAAPQGADTLVTAAAQQPVPPVTPLDPEAARGKQIFETRACIACHAVAGTNARGVIGPNLTRLASRWAVGAGTVPMTHENLVRWIKDPGAIKPGTLMPGAQVPGGGMPPTGLSDDEVNAVATYLMSLK